MDIKHEKALLRKKILAQNAALSAKYTAAADKAISENILSLPEYIEADTVLLFASLPSEISTAPIIDDALKSGKAVAVPLVVGRGKMALKLIRSADELVPGAFGIPEPPDSAEAVTPEEIAFAVIPCVTCDRSGKRLGRGGGYYDRFLSAYPGACALVCREKNICESVPVGEHDVSVPTVVTEAGVFRNGILIM